MYDVIQLFHNLKSRPVGDILYTVRSIHSVITAEKSNGERKGEIWKIVRYEKTGNFELIQLQISAQMIEIIIFR